MESLRLLKQLLMVMTCCLATTRLALAGTGMGEAGMEERGVEEGLPPSFFSHGMNAKRSKEEDISKLLLKHLRFRQLPEPGSTLTPFDLQRESRFTLQQADKRQGQRSLVNNLAALLSGLRDRQAESNMRMPSLRFGK